MTKDRTVIGDLEAADVDDAIAEMLAYAKGIQRKAGVSARRHWETELRLSKSLAVVLVLITSGLHFKNPKDRLYPQNWLSPTDGPDPDEFLSLGFCQLANYAYATIDLIQKGLDTPARALLRAAAELGQILIVVSNDQEAFQVYVANHAGGDKQKWHELFSSRKMAKRLAQLERSLGIPEAVIEEARGWREENAEFFSQAIHHSYHSIVLGGKPSIPGTDKVELSLLGGPNGASRATINHLLVSLNMCLTTFFRVVTEIHQFEATLPDDNHWWQALSLFKFIQPEVKQWLFAPMANPAMHRTCAKSRAGQ